MLIRSVIVGTRMSRMRVVKARDIHEAKRGLNPLPTEQNCAIDADLQEVFISVLSDFKSTNLAQESYIIVFVGMISAWEYG
jgi:hypothetical protein